MKIEERLQTIRSRFEEQEISEDELMACYGAHKEITDLPGFIQHAKRIFPRLCCGVASAYLREVLGVGEVVQGHYGGNPHSFLMHDGILIDITADQYGGPSVYFGPLVPPWSKS